jgi:hypothetical protein
MADMVFPVIMNGKVKLCVPLIARILAPPASDKAFIKGSISRFSDSALNEVMLYFQNYSGTHEMVCASPSKPDC